MGLQPGFGGGLVFGQEEQLARFAGAAEDADRAHWWTLEHLESEIGIQREGPVDVHDDGGVAADVTLVKGEVSRRRIATELSRPLLADQPAIDSGGGRTVLGKLSSSPPSFLSARHTTIT